MHINTFVQVLILGALGGMIWHLRSKYKLDDVEHLLEHIFVGALASAIIVFLMVPTELTLYVLWSLAMVAGFSGSLIVERLVEKVLNQYINTQK